MRIAQVGAGMIPIPPPDYGAVEKHVWNLSQALRDLGHEVSIINRVFGPRGVDEYRFALWARKQVQRGAFDVVHVHTPGVANVFDVLGPRGFVFTTHSRHWATADAWNERVGLALEKRAARRAARVIAVSPFVAEHLTDLDVNGTVIPNGVDVGRYAPRIDDRRGDCVLGLGEVAEHKQWHVAAEAIKGLSARLVLVGPIRDPLYAKRVEDAAPGQVTFMGIVSEDDLVALLGESDVLVHPSVSESFGMAVVEGMASGLPVIASDIVGSLVTHADNGFLVPTRAPHEERVHAVRRHLEMLLSDTRLRRLMGEESRKMAVDAYAWPRVAEKVARVYEEATTG